jgi:membrane-associated protease RseP (regulator of RpoE activity)
LNVAESIRGKPFSLRARANVLRLGLATLALLFVVVMLNDIKSLARAIFG